MGDDPDHPPVTGQPVKDGDRLTEGLLVQGSEALVHKHGIQLDPSGICLYLIRKP